jgi:hypothetical protein
MFLVNGSLSVFPVGPFRRLTEMDSTTPTSSFASPDIELDNSKGSNLKKFIFDLLRSIIPPDMSFGPACFDSKGSNLKKFIFDLFRSIIPPDMSFGPACFVIVYEFMVGFRNGAFAWRQDEMHRLAPLPWTRHRSRQESKKCHPSDL